MGKVYKIPAGPPGLFSCPFEAYQKRNWPWKSSELTEEFLILIPGEML